MREVGMTLEALRRGETASVVGVRIAEGQLGPLGLVPGRIVRLSRRAGATRIVDVRSDSGPWHRVALSRVLASGVEVVPMPEATEAQPDALVRG